MSGVVTIGETMALMTGATPGPLQHSATLTLGIGGAESNVAIALRRLGTAATWIGKVGADPLGDLVVREISAEGVAVAAIRDSDHPTALMIKERRTAAETRIFYYRSGFAGSRLRAEEVDFELVGAADLLHVTGISPALSSGMADVIDHAISVAHDAGVPISFDLNFRSKLWSRSDAAAAFRRIIPEVDIVFAGDDEAAIALGSVAAPMALARGLVDLGAGQAVVKLGALGAVALIDGVEYEEPAIPIVPVDTVGAGDAFVAGYLAEYLAGETPAKRLMTAVTVGAYACLTHGDWEGFPRRAELGSLTATEPVTR